MTIDAALGPLPPPQPIVAAQRARIRAHLSAEYLDITEAIAGNGIAIGSPILFRDEIDAGRMVSAHEPVVGDGRAFWFKYPVARQESRKVIAFRDWLVDEGQRETTRARGYIGRRKSPTRTR